MSTPSYYVVQQYRVTFSSDLDKEWRNNYLRPSSLAVAMKDFRETVLWYPHYSTRLVKAYYCPEHRKEIIREVLEYKEGV